jgi:hypothetical protein
MMKIEVTKSALQAALSVARSTVGSENDIAQHYLFRVREDVVEVLTSSMQVFSCGSLEVVSHDATEDDTAFTTEAWRLDRWLAGVSGDKNLTLESLADGEVAVKGNRSRIRLRSLDPKRFPYWDTLLEGATDVGDIAPQSLSRALSCSRWFVSKDDTTLPELCQIEAIKGVLWATDRRALSLVTVAQIPNLGIRVSNASVPVLMKFLGDKTTQENPIQIREASRPDSDGGGSYAFFVRPDGSYLGITRPRASFPSIDVDSTEEDQSTLKFSRDEFNSAIDVLLAGAPKNYTTVIFTYDQKVEEVRMKMPCETGGENEYVLTTAEVGDGDAWDAPFRVDYSYIKGIAETFSLDEVQLGVNKRGEGGYISFRQQDEEDGGNKYYSVVVWRKIAS